MPDYRRADNEDIRPYGPTNRVLHETQSLLVCSPWKTWPAVAVECKPRCQDCRCGLSSRLSYMVCRKAVLHAPPRGSLTHSSPRTHTHAHRFTRLAIGAHTHHAAGSHLCAHTSLLVLGAPWAQFVDICHRTSLQGGSENALSTLDFPPILTLVGIDLLLEPGSTLATTGQAICPRGSHCNLTYYVVISTQTALRRRKEAQTS